MPPAPPIFRARSFPLARLGVVGRSGTLVIFSRNHFRALIWGLSFAKMLFRIFFRENAFQIGLSIPEVTTPLSYQRQRSPKRASESERGIKPGVQGACPRPSFSPFLGRNGDPRRAGGAPRGAAPRGCFRATHPKGTQHRAAPGRGAGFGPAQGQTCAGPNGTTYRRQRTPAGQAAPPGPT